jgi:hypothetical protein
MSSPGGSTGLFTNGVHETSGGATIYRRSSGGLATIRTWRFGENLTTAAIDVTHPVIGEHWKIGSAELITSRLTRWPVNICCLSLDSFGRT